MTGTLVLQGGGPFVANDELDRQLFGGHERVVVLPTADAFENPERLVAAAMSWGERLGLTVEALMVLQRADAADDGAAQVIRSASAVYLVGDQPLHLRSVVKDTPVWEAIAGVLAGGGVVAACAGSAAALCDPLIDPRGGAFTIGLGLVRGLALMTEADTWSEERRSRTLDLADTPLAEVPTGAALVRDADGWRQVGDVVIHGSLPDA